MAKRGALVLSKGYGLLSKAFGLLSKGCDMKTLRLWCLLRACL